LESLAPLAGCVIVALCADDVDEALAPLYPFLLFLWMRGAGHSVFAVRALSALTGFLLLPLGWRLTVELEGCGSRWEVVIGE